MENREIILTPFSGDLMTFEIYSDLSTEQTGAL